MIIENNLRYLLIKNKPIDFNDDEEASKLKNKLLEFLNADKRIFLSKSIREMLENYNDSINVFEKTLKDDTIQILEKLRNDLSNILRSYQDAMYVNVYMFKNSEIEVKNMILRKNTADPLTMIECIEFVYNDDEDNYNSFNFYMNQGFYTRIWGPIQSGHFDIEDLNITKDESMKVDLCNFICDNSNTTFKIFKDSIIGSTINNKYQKTINNLKVMKNEVINEIDNITDIELYHRNNKYLKFTHSNFKKIFIKEGSCLSSSTFDFTRSCFFSLM